LEVEHGGWDKGCPHSQGEVVGDCFGFLFLTGVDNLISLHQDNGAFLPSSAGMSVVEGRVFICFFGIFLFASLLLVGRPLKESLQQPGSVELVSLNFGWRKISAFLKVVEQCDEEGTVGDQSVLAAV
jgi:hypothetical protein